MIESSKKVHSDFHLYYEIWQQLHMLIHKTDVCQP